jgi:hypothetical protein
MTLDAPPQEFALALLDEFPSQIAAAELDADQHSVWPEVDRLLYYAEQVVAALPAVVPEEQQRHAIHFVEENLARIAQLRGQHLDGWRADGPPLHYALDALAAHGALPLRLAEELAAVYAWRADDSTGPWCAAPRSSAADVGTLAGWHR